MLKTLVKKEFARGEYIATDEVIQTIKDDNESLKIILDGLFKAETVTEETMNLIKGRIFAKTNNYSYDENTNQSCMIVHTFDMLSALSLHAVCHEQMEVLTKAAAEINKDTSKLGGMFDSIATAIVGVFADKEASDKFIAILMQIMNQILWSNEGKDFSTLDERYASMNNKNMIFIDNIIASVKTSVISLLSKDFPEVPIDITQDIFPDYLSHILIGDTLFGGVHILEIGVS